MAAHDGRIYRVLFSPHSKTGTRPEMHNVPVDMFRLQTWLPKLDTGLFTQLNLSEIVLRMADGKEIRIVMDRDLLPGGGYDYATAEAPVSSDTGVSAS